VGSGDGINLGLYCVTDGVAGGRDVVIPADYPPGPHCKSASART
jgi:hypothetical protein